VEGALIHHSIALTIADIARSCAATGDTGVRLLTQDPRYSDETKDLLREIGFEIVGEHGAGGFAELDNETVVFSAFTSAPVKQIIADLARPAAIICAGVPSAGVFNHLKYVVRPLPPWL
jgi:sugar phosphate isomerase/epimerase